MKIISAAIMMSVLMSASPVLAEVTVRDAWVRATPGAGKVTAGYAVLSNGGSADDTLIGIRAADAGMAHLHSSANKDGVMQMKGVDSLVVPAGKGVTLAPGGYHIMIMNLKKPLKAGDEITLVFAFKKQDDVTATAKVMPLSYGGQPSSSGVSHDHDHKH